MVERWNIGFQKDISHFNFIANPVGGGAINPTLHYPGTMNAEPLNLGETMSPPQDPKHTPAGQELSELAGRLAAEQTTMTLATASKDVAWAAPVYYVFYKSTFYFLSDPKSRHIQEALQSGQSSSAIHAAASTWHEIKGLQMTGTIEPVEGGLEALQALKEYLKKYPFTREFFGKTASLDLSSFTERFGVRLYRFIPAMVYYLDNQIRFAFREAVKL